MIAADFPRLSRRSTFGLFLAWTMVALFAILDHGSATVFNHAGSPIDVFMSQGKLREVPGLGDAASYIELGLNLARTGVIYSPGNAPLWSPGMIWLNAALRFVLGSNGPAVLAFAIIVALAWGMMCTQLSRWLYLHTGHWTSTLAPGLVFALPVTREFLLDVGILYSEPLGIAVFFTGTLLLAEAGLVGSWRKAAMAGMLLLAAAMTRQAFEMVGQAASALFVFLLLANAIAGRFLRKAPSPGRQTTLTRLASSQDILYVALALTIFQIGTLAYRTYNLANFGEFRWGFTDYYFAYAWTPAEDYLPVQRFILDAGGNLACQIEPEICRNYKAARQQQDPPSFVAYRSALMSTMMRHPIQWQAAKWPHLAAFWAANPSIGGAAVPGLHVAAILSALGVVTAAAASVILLLRGQGLALPILTAGLIGATYLIAMVLHIEGRYLYPLQIGSVILALAAMAPLRSGRAPRFSLSHWRLVRIRGRELFVGIEQRLADVPAGFYLLFWLLVTLVIALPHGLSSTVSYCCGWLLPVTATSTEIYAHFGDADGGSYARLGRELIEGPPFRPLWSPGMIWLYAVIYKMLGPQAPAAFLVMLAGIAAWGTFCFLFGLTLFRLTGRGLAWLAPATFFLVPTTLQFLLGVGLLFSEPLSTALWGCGMLGCILAAQSRSLGTAMCAGLAFLAAAFVRNAFEIVTQFIFAGVIGLSLLMALIAWLQWRRDRARPDAASLGYALRTALRPLTALIVALVVFQAGAVGYRAYNLVKHNNFAWNFADYYFEQPWLTSSEYTPGMSFVLRGGGNIACEVAPATCANLKAIRDQHGRNAIPIAYYKKLFVRTFATHQIAWQARKIPLFVEYWMSDFAWGGPAAPASAFRPILAALALLGGLAVSVVLLARRRAMVASILFLGVAGGFYLLNSATHLEVRYLIPMQVYAPLILLIALASWRGQGPSEKPNIGSSGN